MLAILGLAPRRLLAASLFGLALVLAPAAQSAGPNGLSSSGDRRGRPVIVTPPVLTPCTNPDAPMAAMIDLETTVAANIALAVWDGNQVSLIQDPQPGYRRKHHVPVLGLKADTSHLIFVVARGHDGKPTLFRPPLSWKTPALPPDFPTIRVDRLKAHSAEPGYLMIGPSFVTAGDPTGPRGSFMVILDKGGNVVWYMRNAAPNQRLRNGNMLIGRTGVEEVDMLGNVLNSWYASGLDDGIGALPGANLVDTDTMHHEFVQMPAGHGSEFLFLSTEKRTYPNYPQSEINPTQTVPSADVVGDLIIEIDRAGNIVRQKHLLDVLDPYRIAYDNSLPFYNKRYGGPTRDWSHANSLYFDPTDDTYIVSMRHQDAVVKLRRSTLSDSPADVVWILGNHSGWKAPWSSKLLDPTGQQPLKRVAYGPVPETPDFEWNYHQHAAFPIASGDLMLFDNGNYRTSPGVQPLPMTTWYSRATQFRIDAAAMTVEQVWTAGGQADTNVRRIGFAPFISNAEEQPQTGNILVNVGASLDFATGVNSVHIFEFDPEDLDDPVLEIRIEEPDRSLAWSNYRARRLESVYPPAPR